MTRKKTNFSYKYFRFKLDFCANVMQTHYLSPAGHMTFFLKSLAKKTYCHAACRDIARLHILVIRYCLIKARRENAFPAGIDKLQLHFTTLKDRSCNYYRQTITHVSTVKQFSCRRIITIDIPYTRKKGMA